MRRALVLPVAALLALLAITGCSGSAAPAPSAPVASSEPLGPGAQSLLRPVAGDPLTSPVAQSETERIAAQLQASIDSERVLNVQNESGFHAGEDSEGYYGVMLTISLTPDTDPLVVGASLTSLLLDAGWSSFDAQNENGEYYAALSSTVEDGGWFVLVEADATVANQSIVTINLASPDIY